MERAGDAGGPDAGRGRRALLSPGQLRVARHKVATRIRALSERDALSLGDTICELMQARRPPAEVSERRALRLTRERIRVRKRLDQLCAQVRQAQGELAEIIAQEAANDALRARSGEDPYVRGLWTELKLLLAGETHAIGAALDRWRAIEASIAES